VDLTSYITGTGYSSVIHAATAAGKFGAQRSSATHGGHGILPRPQRAEHWLNQAGEVRPVDMSKATP